jgi:glucose-1-phosphate thymidylyltransferase
MAGRGSRLRPHTLTVPKPLIPVAGKPIVQRLVEDLAKSYGGAVEEIAFIIGDFGAQVEKDLLAIAAELGAKGSIYHQREPLGTAHAILCAADSLEGNAIVAFADTLFRTDFKIDTAQDGIIWVQEVEDPSAYGVVKLDENGTITDFIEKPDTPVSNLAIVGIYYFRDAAYLRSEMQYLLDNNIKEKGEYQLTNALENMKRKGTNFKTGLIEEWLDCGNKEAVVHSNQRVLEFNKDTNMIAASAIIENSTILQPCFIGENAVVKNSVIGPYVSIGAGTKINTSVIHNSIIQNNSKISDVVLKDSMIGNLVELSGTPSDINIGDYSRQTL